MFALSNMLLGSADTHARRTALWVDGKSYTYEELIRLAHLCSMRLPWLKPRCAVYASRHLSSYAGVLAALLAGHAFVPLSPKYPVQRLGSILQQADVCSLILDDEALANASVRELVANIDPSILVINIDRLDAEAFTVSEQAPETQGDAYLLFTSGSSGEPKGVMVSRENVLSYLRNVYRSFEPTPEDRFSQLFDLSFDLSVHDMLLCWMAGAALYVVPDSAHMAPLRFAREHDLTFWFSTPSSLAVMERFHMLLPRSVPSLRWSLFCGEALPTVLARRWAQVAPKSRLANLYGPTETTIAVTKFNLPEKDSPDWDDLPDIVPIGTAFPEQETAIIDDELYLGGSQVTRGYWRRPALTAERFVEINGKTFYRTGDRAAGSHHGLLFQGRIDRQVKILGHRIELQEVEIVLRKVAATSHVAVIAWTSGGSQRLIAFVDAEVPLSDLEVCVACGEQLPSYMIPSAFVRVAYWPLSVSGKTDYKALTRLLEKPWSMSEPIVLLRALLQEKANGRMLSDDSDILTLGLIDSMALLDIVLEVENKTGLTFNPDNISFEKGMSVQSIAGAFV